MFFGMMIVRFVVLKSGKDIPSGHGLRLGFGNLIKCHRAYDFTEKWFYGHGPNGEMIIENNWFI